MKSVGETMGIGRTFTAAFLKAKRDNKLVRERAVRFDRRRALGVAMGVPCDAPTVR